MAKTKHHHTEDITYPPNIFSTYAIIALVLSAFLVLVFVGRTHIRAQNAARILTLNQMQHTAYQDILRETHTGVRLARWQDFIETAPESGYKQAARLHASVLKAHEKTAWAQYSEHIYTVRANAEVTAKARLQYVANWGSLIRAEQLFVKENEDASKALSFKTAKSIYMQGEKMDALIGAPSIRVKARKTYRRPPTLQKPKQVNAFQEVRIKTARKPNYPRSAKRRGISAEVVLSLNIDDRGRVKITKLVSVKAKRYRGDFVRAAKRAARRSRFHPKMVDGVPVTSSNYQRTYRFVAED